MNVGGVDVVLPVRRDRGPAVRVIDVALRLARHLWPGCVVQDAAESEVHSLTDPREWLYGPRSREFFVYRDSASAAAWQRSGSTTENMNTMIHFLVEDATERRKGLQVTVVVGQLTGEMKQFVDDLGSALSPSVSHVSVAA